MQPKVPDSFKVLGIKRDEGKIMNQRGCCDNRVGNEDRFSPFALIDKFACFISCSRVQVKVDKAREQFLGADLFAWVGTRFNLESRHRRDTKSVGFAQTSQQLNRRPLPAQMSYQQAGIEQITHLAPTLPSVFKPCVYPIVILQSGMIF